MKKIYVYTILMLLLTTFASAITVNSAYTDPATPAWGNTVYVKANVTSDATAVNFTLVEPNGTIAINNVNGTSGTSFWTSTGVAIDQKGQYNYTVTAYNATANNTKTGNFTITNNAPAFNLTSISLIAGVQKTIDLSAYTTDVESDTITYTPTFADPAKASGSVVSGVFTVNASSTTSVSMAVSDGTDTTTQSITLNVVAQSKSVSTTSNTVTLNKYSTGDSGTVTVTVANNGNVNLSDVDITATNFVSGSNTITWSLSDLNNAIAVGANTSASATVTIGSTQASGTYTSTVTIAYDGSSSTYTVSLIVQDPEYELSVPSSVTVENLERNDTVSKTFVINNTGDYTISGLSIDSTANSKYSISFSGLDSSLGVGNSDTITISGVVPDKIDSGKIKIGDIKLTSNQINKTIALYYDVNSNLEIYDLDVEVDGNSRNYNNGDEISNNVKPGSKVKFKVEVKNLLDRDLHYDKIRNIEVKTTIVNIDNYGYDDLYETSSQFDLRGEKRDTTYLSFKIPYDVDEDTYDVVIEVTGEDENGYKQSVEWDLTINVEKDKDEMIFQSASVSPETVTCGRQYIVDWTLRNIGSNNLDYAKFLIKNANLNLFETKTGFDLKANDVDDSKYSKSMTFTVPKNISSATYTLELESYARDNNDDDWVIMATKDLSLTVKCDTDSSSTNSGSSSTTTTSGSTSSSTSVVPGSAPVTYSKSTSFTDSPWFVAILVVSILAVLGIIIWLVFLL